MSESSYGMWWIPSDPERKVAGQLSWGALKAPSLSLLEGTDQMWLGPGQVADLAAGHGVSPGTELVPMLHGRLADHGIVTLLSAQFAGMSMGATSTQRLQIGEALIGAWMDDPDEEFLRRIELDLPPLEAVLGIHPVNYAKPPARRARRISLSLDARRFSWSHGGIDVTWEYRWGSTLRRTGVDVSMTPTLVLMSGKPRSLRYWIDEWIYPMNQLLQVATGSRSNPRSMTGWQQKMPTPAERSATSIAIWIRGVGDHEPEFDPREVFMRAQAIALNPLGLHDVISRVRRLAVDQEAFLGLLSDVIVYKDRPLRNRYLDLMGALEAYHTQVYGLGPVKLDKFKSERKAALDGVAAAGVALDLQRFIKRWLPSRSHFSLETRLRKLGTVVGVAATWSVDARTMAQLRNDVAHGNTGLSGATLQTAYDQAFSLARYVVFRELGLVNPAPATTTP